MKSIDKLTIDERIAVSTPFFKKAKDGLIKFTDELTFELEEEQEEEINQLITDIAAQSITRLLQFIADAGTDKQIIARIVCLQKLYDNKHGNWLDLGTGHDVTIKSIRHQRDKINDETGMYIQ